MLKMPYLKSSDLNLLYFNNSSLNTLVFCHGGAWITNKSSDFIEFGKLFSRVNVVPLSYNLSTKPSGTVVYPQAYLEIREGLETLINTGIELGKITIAGIFFILSIR